MENRSPQLKVPLPISLPIGRVGLIAPNRQSGKTKLELRPHKMLRNGTSRLIGPIPRGGKNVRNEIRDGFANVR